MKSNTSSIQHAHSNGGDDCPEHGPYGDDDCPKC